MLGARAMALVRLGRFEEAADWGIKAAARPNAHAHILAIAALSLALAGRLDEARAILPGSTGLCRNTVSAIFSLRCGLRPTASNCSETVQSALA